MTPGGGYLEGCSDGETIAASLNEPARFAQIFDRHYDGISSYLIRRVGRVLGEDLASDTFVRAFAQRDGYDPAYPDARPWLYAIATNLVRKHARSEERRRRAYARAIDREEGADAVEGVAERLDAAVAARRAAVALSRLSPADQDTLLLFALTDLDYEGIAIATGVPVGTVRSRVHRTRRLLRAALSTEDGVADDAISNRSRI